MNFAAKSGENWGDSGGGAALYNGGKQAPFSSMPASITYWPPTAGKLLTKAPQGNQQRFPEENNCLITVSAQEKCEHALTLLLPRGGHCVNALQTFSQYVLGKHNEWAPFHNPNPMGLFFRSKLGQQQLCAVHSLFSPASGG